MKVLVAYESVHGSTRSIAENIARSLAAHFQVTTRPMRETDDLSAFDAFVLGSAERGRTWVPQANEFLRHHTDQLTGKPVWLFSVGVSGAMPRPLRRVVREREERELVLSTPAGLQPRGRRVFTGMVRRDWLSSRGDRLWLSIGREHDRDLRAWPEIMSWAQEIAAALEAPVAS